MTSVRKVETHVTKSTDFQPSEVYMVTLTHGDIVTVEKSALVWDIDKPKALELIINGGLALLCEVLPVPGHPRPPRFK